MSQAKSKVNPVAVGLTGLVLGAAAGATITTLSDPKNRQRAKKQMDSIGDQAKKMYQRTSKQVENTWKQLEPELRQTGRQFKHRTDNQAADMEDKAEDAKDEVAELATKGGEVLHEANDNQNADQFKHVKDLTNH